MFTAWVTGLQPVCFGRLHTDPEYGRTRKLPVGIEPTRPVLQTGPHASQAREHVVSVGFEPTLGGT